MAHGNLLRRALTDVPVNTSASPREMNLLNELPQTLKRQIHKIDDPEYPLASARLRLHSRKILRGHLSKEGMGADQKNTSSNLAKLRQLQPHPQIIGGVEEMKDRSLSNSSIESTCSLPEFDVGDETIASQETTATEVTRTVESMAALDAETLRLRLRVALFKVLTNQTSIPMSQLQISRHESIKPLEPGTTPSSPLEEPSLPKLLPAPILRPTAYSARTIPRQQIPTSPPDSILNSPKPATEASHSPKLAIPPCKQYPDPIQTSSPPDSPESLSARVEKGEILTRSAERGKRRQAR
ncbi:hypothetical protein MMC07_005855 [Pseudocyphellaria aurata]|nr:hypothetical protein [Pseudocyphellaria aurata]